MATLWLVGKGLYFLHAEFCTGFFSHAVALLKINSFQNVFEGYHWYECQTVRIQIRPNFLSGLIWVQTVCKWYQQATKIVPIRTHLLQTAHMKRAENIPSYPT